ncbi:MAG TPA: hypothetical protein VNL35_05880 [Chloroflexota bacterium]|nr:hypothetical protein [Chloroflexota bacterium]
MFIPIRRGLGACLLVPALTLGLIGPPGGKQAHAATTTILPVVALAGYQVSVFATGTTNYTNPDSILTDGRHVFVGYQNITAKDGTDNQSSTVVEYTLSGQIVRTFSVLGHCDGLRMNPTTHLLWAVSNEDGNPRLVTIDPASGAETPYAFAATAHGGGFDDLAFTHGVALISASNPNLDKNGVNIYPALDRITLSHGKASVTPVLMGNGTAIDLTSNTNATVALNVIDPDSLTINPQGNIVLDNQAGSQLIFIALLGTKYQSITTLPVGNQVDDTVWATSAQGTLLISDTSANTIYAVRSSTFLPGTVYGTTPNDSGVAGMLGIVDQGTGIITPVAIGFGSPHGMLFLPGAKQ